MRVRFFEVPVGCSESEAEVNAFLTRHRVLDVSEHFVPRKGYWALCVRYLQGEEKKNGGERRSKGRKEIDWVAELPEEASLLYRRLRDVRKERVPQGTPVYVLARNEHLARMAQEKPLSVAELKACEGLPEKQVEAHGEAFVQAIAAFLAEREQEARGADGSP